MQNVVTVVDAQIHNVDKAFSIVLLSECIKR